MHQLLNHPAVQAGLAPFLVALISAELLQRIKLSGLAVIAGFAATVYLVSSFSIEPLTASRKIVVLGLSAALFALPLGLLKGRWISPLLVILGGTAAIWTTQHILQQQNIQLMALWGSGCAFYVATLVWGMDKLEKEPLRAAHAATVLGLSTGVSALLGASGLLGQFGLAIGSAAAAHLLVQIISNQTLPTGRTFTLTVSIITGLTGCLAVLSTQLPWYTLPVLACIPIAAWLLPMPKNSALMHSLMLSLLTLPLAAGAVYLTWKSTGNLAY